MGIISMSAKLKLRQEGTRSPYADLHTMRI
jgi:hypothetical protein